MSLLTPPKIRANGERTIPQHHDTNDEALKGKICVELKIMEKVALTQQMYYDICSASKTKEKKAHRNAL